MAYYEAKLKSSGDKASPLESTETNSVVIPVNSERCLWEESE
jgi:hypothetical protein